MGNKCAIICEKETLLCQAMTSLLANDARLEVHPILTNNPRELFSALDDMLPDTVVLIKTDEEVHSSLLYELLRTYPGMHVVSVGIDENLIYVYPDRILIQKPAELLSIIHSM